MGLIRLKRSISRVVLLHATSVVEYDFLGGLFVIEVTFKGWSSSSGVTLFAIVFILNIGGLLIFFVCGDVASNKDRGFATS